MAPRLNGLSVLIVHAAYRHPWYLNPLSLINNRYIKLFGTAYSDAGFGIAADSSQNAYVVGYTGGSLSVGGYSVTAKGSVDACKYSI